MKKIVLAMVLALTSITGAQAQKTSKQMIVKNVDGTEFKISLSDIEEITFDEINPSHFTEKPFKVSDSKTVFFSPGNLQYNPNTKKYRFAEHQYDALGDKDVALSGWRDLFPWSDVDWGTNVEDGNTWFTLSAAEWQYLIDNNDIFLARVGDINGVALLPEDMKLPKDATWDQCEAAGAVFLPAAGFTQSELGKIDRFGQAGGYWTNTRSKQTVSVFSISSGQRTPFLEEVEPQDYQFSVRLVKSAKNFVIDDPIKPKPILN